MEFVGGANGGLIGDGSGESPEAEGRGGAWERAEGGKASAESIVRFRLERHGHGHRHRHG